MRPYFFDFERYRWRGTYPPEGACSVCRTLGELLRAGFSMLALWSRRVRQRRELATYDRSMLRDIGVTPSEVASEVRKPFWRA